jgi:mannose-6-phosphate isomerase-like protein (cupin superfamily)
MQAMRKGYMLGAEDGQAIWFAGTLMVLKATGEHTEGRFALLDQRVPGQYAAPLHVHHDEDEAWYLLDGEATFSCGDDRFSAGAGAWVFLPKGVPHAFRVGPTGARLLTFSAPARFAAFVQAAGEPAQGHTLPPAGPMDVEQLAAIAGHYGIDILGPPPA